MIGTIAIILIVMFVIYANKTDSVYGYEEYNDQHKNDIDKIVEEIERDIEEKSKE